MTALSSLRALAGRTTPTFVTRHHIISADDLLAANAATNLLRAVADEGFEEKVAQTIQARVHSDSAALAHAIAELLAGMAMETPNGD